MKLINTYIAKISYYPLFEKGDEFVIVKINKDKNLMPIIAKKLKNGEIFGFYEGELKRIK